jgi:nicotinamide-nucleotide adenylyltransferase
VLFLLATVNADKKPKPADFEDRLVMMALAAQDLRSSFLSNPDSSSPKPQEGAPSMVPIIDIGITKLPYFVDKASSIASSNIYTHSKQAEQVVEQIHLTGFDTLLRIFTPKYYPDHNPPLSALEPFLRHHRVRATIRVDPGSTSENLKDAQKSGGTHSDLSTIEGQTKYLEDIKQGSLETEGMQRHWAGQVDLVVDDSGDAEGVSSTKVREAVQMGNWEVVNELVGPGVAHWIKEGSLYLEGKGTKDTEKL